MSFIEAFIKIWDHILISSRAHGDRVLLYSTVYSVTGAKGLGKRKAHLSALMKSNNISFKLLQLPDVSEFGIVLGLVNPLLLAFGLVGRYASQVNLQRYRNRRSNKYLTHVFTKLVEHMAAGRVSRFWTLSMLLVRRSNVYMTVCSWKIDKNLYRNLSQRAIGKLFKEVNQLRSSYSTDMKFHRTYIPKGETHRPLGVPSLAWRIYLNMLLHPLTIAHPLPSCQHGFKPGYGTLTAWATMFKEVIVSPNIYEGDLRQCFPSVNLLRLAVTLIKQGMPANVVGLYHQLNMVSPEFKGAILLNENQFLLRDHYKELLRQDPSRTPLNFDKPIWNVTEEWVREQILLHGEEALGIHGEVLLNFLDSSRDQQLHYDLILEGLMHIFVEFKEGTPISEFVHYADWLKFIGTAQGSPLSPYLAAIALTQVTARLPEGVKALFYADDFILYGEGLTEVTLHQTKELFKEAGFTIHNGKSQWIKRFGIVRQDWIKFLGLIWDFELREFRAATRKGSTLVFNKEDLLSFEFDKKTALSTTSSKLFEQSKKFYRWSKLNSPGWNKKLSSAMFRYNLSLAYFRKWFVTEFQWDLLALLRTVMTSGSWTMRRFITLGIPYLRDLDSARAFARATYPETKALAIIDKSDTQRDSSEISHASAIDPKISYALNYVNPYLRRYRSKYTFVNFCASKFRGIIQSRMYSGSWIQSMPLQVFTFSYKRFSLAQLMRVFITPNIFNGSSIALYVLVRTLSKTIHSKSFSQRYPKAIVRECRKLRSDKLLANCR